jgi:hypothetical protein
MKMNKKFVIGITLGMILIASGIIVTAVQAANPSYVVYGIVIKNNGIPNDGAIVTITNTETAEFITTTSFTDTFGNVGSFQANLGNLPAGWERGDVIDVFARSGSWQGRMNFTIPADGTMYNITNVSMAKTTGGGGRERGNGHLFTPGFESIGFIAALGISMAVLIMSRKKKQQ